MAKSVHNDVLDAALSYVKNNGIAAHYCTSQPTTYVQATTTYNLATKSPLTSASYTGPADGDTNGRKITVNAQSSVSVTTAGTAAHVALTAAASVLLYVTTCTSQVLVASTTFNVPAWDIEIADPT